MLITGDGVGGVGVHAGDLAQGLAASGHQVTLVFLGTHQGTIPSLPAVECLVAPWPLEWQSECSPSELAAAATATRAWLARIAAARGIELLHANHFALVDAIPKAPTLLGIHSDVFSWWRWVQGTAPPSSAFANWYGSVVRAALRNACAVVAPSQTALLDLRESFAWDGVGYLIPHGIRVAAAPPKSRPLFAMTAGRLWDEGKNVGLLARADLAVEVEVAGDDQGRPLPASSRLRLLGKLDRSALARRLADAAIYVATSRYEPFGLAPLEAAAAGCALLLNDIPSLREVWGSAAFYFARNDGPALARALRQLRDAPLLRARLGAASHHRANWRYRSQSMIRAYVALYQKLLAR